MRKTRKASAGTVEASAIESVLRKQRDDAIAGFTKDSKVSAATIAFRLNADLAEVRKVLSTMERAGAVRTIVVKTTEPSRKGGLLTSKKKLYSSLDRCEHCQNTEKVEEDRFGNLLCPPCADAEAEAEWTADDAWEED